MPFDFGGNRHESGVTESDLDERESPHTRQCDECGADLCSCGILCDGASREKVVQPFSRLCAVCAEEVG